MRTDTRIEFVALVKQGKFDQFRTFLIASVAKRIGDKGAWARDGTISTDCLTIEEVVDDILTELYTRAYPFEVRNERSFAGYAFVACFRRTIRKLDEERRREAMITLPIVEDGEENPIDKIADPGTSPEQEAMQISLLEHFTTVVYPTLSHGNQNTIARFVREAAPSKDPTRIEEVKAKSTREQNAQRQAEKRLFDQIRKRPN